MTDTTDSVSRLASKSLRLRTALSAAMMALGEIQKTGDLTTAQVKAQVARATVREVLRQPPTGEGDD